MEGGAELHGACMLCLLEMPGEDWGRHGDHSAYSLFSLQTAQLAWPGLSTVFPGVFDFSVWLCISALEVLFPGS